MRAKERGFAGLWASRGGAAPAGAIAERGGGVGRCAAPPRTSPRRGKSRNRLLAAAAVAIAGCGGAGPYGFGRTYSPLDPEEKAIAGSEKYDPVMARRLPEEWRTKTVHLFGVVLARDEGDEGRADLTLGVRRLAARNLCESGAEDSCRVTVGDSDRATVHALVSLSQQDAIGNLRVQPRSLVRVVGRIQDKPNRTDGTDVVLASYYRHWPPGYFVTEQARSYMKR